VGRENRVLSFVLREKPVLMSESPLHQERLKEAALQAWRARDSAYTYGNTKVGAVAISDRGEAFSGCNVEHRFRSHDVHAEVNAISTMVCAGVTELAAVVIVSERERFTPCGACLDWIFEFGGADCVVAFQSTIDGSIDVHLANELMPFYPM
jgi:cytidine deaminase